MENHIIPFNQHQCFLLIALFWILHPHASIHSRMQILLNSILLCIPMLSRSYKKHWFPCFPCSKDQPTSLHSSNYIVLSSASPCINRIWMAVLKEDTHNWESLLLCGNCYVAKCFVLFHWLLMLLGRLNWWCRKKCHCNVNNKGQW